MKVLQVDCSILGSHSVSRALTAEFVAALGPGLSVDRMDLVEQPLEHQTLQDLKQIAPELQRFLAADLVVMGLPMYNLSVPSQLRAFLDRLVQKDVTFEDLQQARTRGLLKDKTIVAFSTRGAVVPPESDFQESYLRAVMGFIGLQRVHILRAEGLALPKEGPQALARVRGELADLAGALRAQAFNKGNLAR